MKKTKLSLLISAVTLLGACTQLPSSAYFNRAQPESLLSVATETVIVDISKGSTQQLSSIINHKEPNTATVSCTSKSLCDSAAEVLTQFGIPFEIKSGNGDKVSLNYQNVVARDCDNRFITNHNNPYNLNHPTFGCSTAVNQVLMVGDKRQFTDPLLLGPYDGQKATQNFDTYLSRDNASNILNDNGITGGNNSSSTGSK